MNKECQRCRGELRPQNHGLHKLHWALDRPICPKCWLETQPERLERGKAKEVFNASLYPDQAKKRLWDEIRSLVKEREDIRLSASKEIESLRRVVYDGVRDQLESSIRRMSLWNRLRLLFNPFAVSVRE